MNYRDLVWMPPALVLGSIREYNKRELFKRKQQLKDARLIGFYVAKTLGADINKPEDLGEFQFEEDDKEIKPIKVTIRAQTDTISDNKRKIRRGIQKVKG